MADGKTGSEGDITIGIANAGMNADSRTWITENRGAHPVITTYCNPPDENGVHLATDADWTALPPGAHAYLYVTPAFIRPSDVVAAVVRAWDEQSATDAVVGYLVVRAEG